MGRSSCARTVLEPTSSSRRASIPAARSPASSGATSSTATSAVCGTKRYGVIERRDRQAYRTDVEKRGTDRPKNDPIPAGRPPYVTPREPRLQDAGSGAAPPGGYAGRGPRRPVWRALLGPARRVGDQRVRVRALLLAA